MLLNDPATYMRLRGHAPNLTIECAVCPKRFEAKDGVAFPARDSVGNPIMALFCSNICYLAAMPTQILGRA